MRKLKTMEEAYESCVAGGYFRDIISVNMGRVRSLLVNAETNIDSANTLARSIPKEDKRWMTVYTLHYEATRICAETFLMLDKIVSQNHQCLFACLCVKHPELGLDWNFFEKIRTKRNGVNYYGEHVSYKEWKEDEPTFSLCIIKLKSLIEKKLAK